MKSLLTFAWLAIVFCAHAAGPGRTQFDLPMADPEEQKEPDWIDDRWQKTDVGPFLCGTIATPGKATYKGIAIKLGEHNEASVCFDTDLLRMSAGWTGGFVRPDPARYGLIKPIRLVRDVLVFSTAAGPGWARKRSFADPRARPFGPLPRDWAKYRGLYLSGSRVVLNYSVGDAEVLEFPWCETVNGLIAITRTFEIAAAKEPMLFLASSRSERAKPKLLSMSGVRVAASQEGETIDAVAVGSTGAQLVIAENGDIQAAIAPHDAALRMKIFYWKGLAASLPQFAALVKDSAAPEDLRALTRGGPAHWARLLVTRGQIDLSANAFAIDTLTMPYQNPWNALMFASGNDFFPNGDAAVCTVHGDVWRVSGIDEKLTSLKWKRFATGLFQPLGLKIVDGKAYVLGRDQITLLEDLNNDGEADHYINFNNDAEVDGGGHGYATCLETDSAGNFYYLRCNSGTVHSGSLLGVSRDGAKLEVVATGFRNPNGLGIGPHDTITVADQEGEWVPATRLDIIKPGGFYGFMPAHHRATKPAMYDPPLCWMPKVADNSAGSQVWITSDKWGALKGQMLHLSYGHCSMLLALREEIDGQSQGGVVPLPGRFLSGVMRGAFHPHDGQLYVTGLRGWQTSAARDGCFQRVRCKPDKVHLPISLTAHTNGLRVAFNAALDPSTAGDAGSFAAERWNYHWTEHYGSKDWSVTEPNKEGHDTVSIVGAKLSSDGKAVFLSIPDLKPAMQMKLRYNLTTATGRPVRGEIYHTIHRLGSAWQSNGIGVVR